MTQPDSSSISEHTGVTEAGAHLQGLSPTARKDQHSRQDNVYVSIFFPPCTGGDEGCLNPSVTKKEQMEPEGE
jgi:hypothetical protein